MKFDQYVADRCSAGSSPLRTRAPHSGHSTQIKEDMYDSLCRHVEGSNEHLHIAEISLQDCIICAQPKRMLWGRTFSVGAENTLNE